MRLARTRAGTWSFGDLVEVARHRAASGRFDELVAFALAACDALGGAVAVAGYLGEVMPTVTRETDRYLMLADRELRALLASGSTTAALQRMQVMLTLSIDRATAEPDNTAAHRDLSVSYNKLGELMVRVGNGAEAERLFRTPNVKGSFVAAAALRIDPAVRPVGSGSAEERVKRALLQRGIALAVNMGGHGKRRVGRKRSSSTPRSTPGTRCAPAT